VGTLSAPFSLAHPGFSVGSRGRNAHGAPAATALAFLDEGPGTSIATQFRRWHDVGHKDGASTKKLAGLRQFSGNACGVLDSGVPIGALESDTVRKQAVSVDDMKEVSHPAGLGRMLSRFQ
jgi:hypothetical protein